MSSLPPRLPAWARILIPLLFAANAVALTLGLALDFVMVQKNIQVWGFSVFEESNTLSILSGLRQLWEEGHEILAALIFAFSVVFPVAKLIAAIGLHFAGA